MFPENTDWRVMTLLAANRACGLALTITAAALCATHPAAAPAAPKRFVFGRSAWPVGGTPIAVTAGDLNGDGRADLVTADSAAHTVTVLLAKQGGAFAPGKAYGVGMFPRAVTLADVTGDGAPDIAAVNQNCSFGICGPGSVAVLPGVGDGSFLAATLLPAGTNPQEVAAADLDHDGDVDLAVTNAVTVIQQGPGTVSILLNQGNGTFFPETQFPAGGGVGEVAAADLDGDGTQDLAITNGIAILVAHAVAVLHGEGDGSFAAPVLWDTGTVPTRLEVGRFDGDPYPDLAVLASGDSSVSLLRGNGDGTFQPRVDYPAGFGSWGLTASDLDRDGDLDLAVTTSTAMTMGGSIGVLSGRGDGTFEPFDESMAGVIGPSVTSGDFDADGTADLAAPDRIGSVIVFRGAGGGTLVRAASYPAGALPAGIARADFDGDADADLAVADAFGGFVSILRGDGAGGFGPPRAFPAGTLSGALAARDFNHDGRADIAVVNTPGGVSVLLGDGNGSLGPGTPFATGPAPVAIVAAEFTGDGTLDLATANLSGSVSILRGRGDGKFLESVNSPAGPAPAGLAAADLNGDGRLDLAVAAGGGTAFGPGVVAVLFGIGDGRFEPQVSYEAGISADAIAIADVNADRLPDLVVGTNLDVFGSIWVLPGAGGGTFVSGPVVMTGALTFAVAAVDVNGDRRPDLLSLDAFSNTLTVYRMQADGTPVLQGRYDPGPILAGFAVGDFNRDGLFDVAASNQLTGAVSVLLSEPAAPLSRKKRIGRSRGRR